MESWVQNILLLNCIECTVPFNWRKTRLSYRKLSQEVFSLFYNTFLILNRNQFFKTDTNLA